MSSNKKSFSNYGYQMDDLDSFNRENDANYTIPKAHIDRSTFERKNQQSPDKIDAPDYNDPEDTFPLKLERKQSIRPTEEAKTHVDHTLLSYLNNFSCYRAFTDNWWTKEREKKFKAICYKLFLSLLALLYIGYFTNVILRNPLKHDDDINYWCDSAGFLIIITCLAVTGIFYFHIFKPFIGIPIYKRIKTSFERNESLQQVTKVTNHWLFTSVIVLAVFAAIIAFLVIDTKNDRSRLVSAMGLLVLLLFGFIFSAAPRKVRWRHVIWGFVLQFVFGLFILRWSVGRATFSCLGKKVDAYLTFTDAGSKFIFGDVLVEDYQIFAFKVLSVIIFFAFCIQILYFYGIMQWIVMKIGWLLQVTIGTTACESVNASANIFLGQTEAPLLIKPYLSDMTRSELHAVMTGGFATIAGSVLAAYILLGIDPSNLLSASVMSAPAALGFAKLFYPEVEKSKTTSSNIKIVKGTEANVLHAACEGVTNAIPLVANVGANLIAFIAFVALIDATFNWFCVLVNVEDGVCTLSSIFGYAFMPLSWILGIQWKDCYDVGQLIGTKIFVNEFVAYLNLQKLIKAGAISARSITIATYALCGFSNISSIGIQIGGLGAMAPDRKRDLATVALRAMIAGNCACFLTACVAGTLIPTDMDFDVTDNINATLTDSFL